MKLSQTEYQIKKQLAETEIQPSKKLWDNIQSELDKKTTNKSKGLWVKLSGIAALLCICFLAYKGLQNTQQELPNLVLEQKGKIHTPVKFEKITFDYIATSQNVKENKSLEPIKAQTSAELTSHLVSVPEHTVAAEEVKESNLESEVDDLLQMAYSNIAIKEKDKQLIAEVDNLLQLAIQGTNDTEQIDILKKMQSRMLLAEVEADLELNKPPKLKDKIWEAIVANYNDLKDSVALN